MNSEQPLAVQTHQGNAATGLRLNNNTGGQPTRLAFSVKEAAALLGISEKSVRRLIDRGLIRSSRALRHLLIPKREIERFLQDTLAA
jgi:excisionase family DNA binding protein